MWACYHSTSLHNPHLPFSSGSYSSHTPSYYSAPSSFRGRGRDRGRERNRDRGSSFPQPRQSAGGQAQCQICNSFDYYANQCYNCYDDSANPTSLLHYYGNSPIDPNWYVDSGVTHHLAADIANLVVHSEYQGPDRVCVGNETGCLSDLLVLLYYVLIFLLLS